VLFKHAKELTRTLGGNVDDPSLLGWNQPEPARTRKKGQQRERQGAGST
jgi:hypothetical protein